MKKRGRPPSNSVSNKPFSLLLSSVLATRGMTNEALAKAADIGAGTINAMLKSGNPTIKNVWKLEDALGLNRGYLCSPGYPRTASSSQGEKLELPFPAGARPAENLIERPVRGLAAADDSHGTRVPDTDELGEPYRFPESLVMVPVVGDSMSPIVQDGQYVSIDREREGFERDGGIYVVSVREPEPGDDYREDYTGTFVKLCAREENLYYLKSINAFSPFSVHVDHCRLWPVLGVWYGGKGVRPEGF